MDEKIRQPIVAGAFYPGRPEQLASTVTSLLGGDFDRPSTPLREPVGIVVPHAGYPYSGATAAAGFRAAAVRGRPHVVILIGASHTGVGPSVSLGDHYSWRTPLGEIAVNTPLVERLVDAGLPVDNSAFTREHSLEVQLPFLQTLWGNSVHIVPLCVQPAAQHVLVEAGRCIARTVDEQAPVLIVASSDFTHYEPDKTARKLDHAALERILALDVDGFLGECATKRLTICGAGAIAVTMTAVAALNLTETKLLQYATSGDTTGDRSAVVGYAAVSFTRRDHD